RRGNFCITAILDCYWHRERECHIGRVCMYASVQSSLSACLQRSIYVRCNRSSRDHVGSVSNPSDSMAKVEGLRLSKESAARLERTKGLSPEKRRAEVLRAYGADAPKRK